MNVLSAVWRLTVLGSEYSAAWSKATQSLDEGSTLGDALEAFAAETSTGLDDQAVDAILAFLGDAVDKIDQGAGLLERAADELEKHGPLIVALLRQYREKALTTGATLKELR